MSDSRRLLCVLAHPDDESLGLGGAIAKYAAEGAETYLVTATRGERGWTGDEKDYPGPEALGKIREAELLAAARVLGLRSVDFLGYLDGDLDRANPGEVVSRIAGHIRRLKPQVVLTFDPSGAYGHPDHIAICQFTTAAIVAAADHDYVVPPANDWPAHTVSKLYYYAPSSDLLVRYERIFGEFAMPVDGMLRRSVPWQDWALNAAIHCEQYAQQVWQAVACHKSQLPNYGKLEKLSPEEHLKIWGLRTFYRAFSLVNGGRHMEDDLFEGVRGEE
jgi:LmbE family N-acetylglucosaminyl deacetylase